MQMPDLDGIATAHRIRDEATTRDVPIIALTSIGRSIIDNEKGLGIAATVSKPVKQTELRMCIEATIRSTTAPPVPADGGVDWVI